MIDLDHGADGAQRLVFRDLLHRQDRTAGDVVLVEDFHRLELVVLVILPVARNADECSPAANSNPVPDVSQTHRPWSDVGSPSRIGPRTLLARLSRIGSCGIGGSNYSGLMLAARITFAHLCVSSTTNFSKSEGERTRGVRPRSAYRAFMPGLASPALI
jgi:hypothetical protein